MAINVVDNALAHRFAIMQEHPLQTDIIEGAEQVFVANTDAALLYVEWLCPDVLIFIADFIDFGIGLAVGTDESVAVEVIVRWVVAVVVATIFIDVSSFGILAMQGLVDEVPDKTSLELGITTHEVPILLETATAVAHCMAVLALNKWLLLAVILSIPLAMPLRHIHRAEDIGIVATVCLLILNGTAWVFVLNPLIGCGEVRTIDRFIA